MVTIYRKNTTSDKGVSFISILLALLLLANSIKVYQMIGKIYAIDMVISLVALMTGVLFLYTSRFKYIELSEESFAWYTWFFVRHRIDKSHIKEVEVKTHYIILKKANNKEEWIPTKCIKHEDLSKLLELLECLKEKITE